MGPCAGKAQIIQKAGDIVVSSVRGGDWRYNDYLTESIHNALSEAGIVQTIRHDLIDWPVVQAV
jgi:hypothetical protein